VTEIEKIELTLKRIDEKAKTIPKELKAYLHTVENLQEDEYLTFLDEAGGEEIIIWSSLSEIDLSDKDMFIQF